MNLLAPEADGLDLDAALAHFREHGWARLGKVLSDEYAALLRARADDVMLGRFTHESLFFQADSASGKYDDLAFGQGWHGPSLDYRKIEKLEVEPAFCAWIENPLFRSLTRKGIGESVSLYRAVLWTKSAAGGTELPYHQDGGRFWGVDRDPTLQVWTALDDAPAEAGCVEVASGTHLAGLVGPDGGGVPDEAVARVSPVATPLPVRAGEALLIHNHVWHRSGRNTSGQPRRAFAISFMDGATRCTRKKRAPRQFVKLFSGD